MANGGRAVALRVSDVGLLRRRVRVERAMAEVGGKAIFGEPKDHERRAVPLPAFVVDGLAAHLAGRASDALFPHTLRAASLLGLTLGSLGEHQQARQIQNDTLTRSRPAR